MKGMLHKFSLLALLAALLLAGCEKDGKNGWLYSEGKDFQPVTNLTGEAGYGYALLRWELPAKADQLTMIDVSWVNTDNEMEYKKLTRFDDSLWLDLEMKDYTFRVASCGVSGDVFTDSVSLKVPDWRTEPVEIIQNVEYTVIENGIYLKWTSNYGRAFAKTTFDIYDANGVLQSSVVRTKEESSNVQFENLGYNTDYVLRYYSENIAGMRTDSVRYEFKTDRQAPNMPTINVVDRAGEKDALGNTITTTVFAYSTEIKWENIDPQIDSIRITFTGLNKCDADFRFSAADEAGYLSMLPGGEVAIAVSARMKGDDEWSASKAQRIKTPEPTATYVFRYPNAPGVDKNSHIGRGYEKNTTNSDAGYSQTKAYVFADLVEKCPDEFGIFYKPQMLDEIALFVTIKKLVVGKDGTMSTVPPGSPSNAAPSMDEFRKLIPRLKYLKTLQIRKGYGGTYNSGEYNGKKYVDVFLEEFSNKDKYPNLETVEVVN